MPHPRPGKGGWHFKEDSSDRTVVALKDLGGLDALPGGAKLDEHALLVDAVVLVKLHELKCLLDRALLVEGEPGVDLEKPIQSTAKAPISTWQGRVRNKLERTLYPKR